MMVKEGSTNIENFMTPGVKVLRLRRGHMRHNSEYAFYSILSIYNKKYNSFLFNMRLLSCYNQIMKVRLQLKKKPGN